MNTVHEIKMSTLLWNQERWNAKRVKLLLEKGTFFTITRSDFEKWDPIVTDQDFLHAYPAIVNDELKFVLIDSVTDKKTFDGSSLPYTVIKDYRDDYSIDAYDFIVDETAGNITVIKALKRVMRWGIMRESWIEDQIDSFKDGQVGIFRVFNIPFNDIKNAFAIPDITELIVNIGLKKRKDTKKDQSKFSADLLLWSVGTGLKIELIQKISPVSDDQEPVADLVGLCPPFGQDPESEYNVINP